MWTPWTPWNLAIFHGLPWTFNKVSKKVYLLCGKSMDVHGLLLKVHAKSTQSPHQVHTESMQVHSSIFPLLILSMDFYGLFKYFGLRVYKKYFISLEVHGPPWTSYHSYNFSEAFTWIDINSHMEVQ